MKTKIAPSLLSADYSKLREEISRMEKAGADLIHWDVMDACYVPMKNFSSETVEKNRSVTRLPFDVHLMVCKPEEKAEAFIQVGADWLSFHVETCENPKELIGKIKQRNVKAGLAVNANIPIEAVFPFLEEIDFVLIMAVLAGKPGQSFIPKTLQKIEKLKQEIEKRNLQLEIEVDGGITKKTAEQCRNAGATVLVSGSTIFKSENAKETIEKLRKS